MYIETWYKVQCIQCGVDNWVCDGDVSDLSGEDIDAIECHCCNTCFWFGDEWIAKELHGQDAIPEDYAEKGREHP